VGDKLRRGWKKYVWSQRIWFLDRPGLNRGKDFDHLVWIMVYIMHLPTLSHWAGETGHRRGIWRYKSAHGSSFVEFFWPTIMLLERGICIFLTQNDFPGAGHFNSKTDPNSSPTPMPPHLTTHTHTLTHTHTHQQLNIDRCMRDELYCCSRRSLLTTASCTHLPLDSFKRQAIHSRPRPLLLGT